MKVFGIHGSGSCVFVASLSFWQQRVSNSASKRKFVRFFPSSVLSKTNSVVSLHSLSIRPVVVLECEFVAIKSTDLQQRSTCCASADGRIREQHLTGLVPEKAKS